MTQSYKICYIILLWLVRYKLFGIKMISIFKGILYENIKKWQIKCSVFRTTLTGSFRQASIVFGDIVWRTLLATEK